MKFYAAKLSENISETPEGFLVCHDVSIGRVGSMEYGPGECPIEPGPNGKTIIQRTEKELFRPETIASFEGKSVTIQHPKDFVNPLNFKELEKGSVQNVRRGKGEAKDDLVADLLIKDKAAIELIKAGLREVSCGYEAEYTQTGPGEGYQSNIIGNHLALVEQGRAGESYAINDHKGAFTMKWKEAKEKVQSIFSRAQDEAMKTIDEAGGPEITSKNQETEARGKGYDELVKAVHDLGEKVSAMSGDDGESEASGGQGTKIQKPAKAAGKDEDGEEKEKSEDAEGDMDARLKKCEMMIEKLMKAMGHDEAYDDDEEMEVTDDDEEESEDDDFEESHMTGDTASRAEILAPGVAKTKDVKRNALKAAYATKDGKKVIDALSLGKAPNFKDQKVVDHLFVSASEIMKLDRSSKLKETKVADSYESLSEIGKMTPEKMNEINEKHWNRKQ